MPAPFHLTQEIHVVRRDSLSNVVAKIHSNSMLENQVFYYSPDTRPDPENLPEIISYSFKLLELLNSMIAGTSDINLTIKIYCDTRRTVKLPVPGSITSPPCYKNSVRP